MSLAPNNLPKRTRVLAKDLIFQEKYNLTDTQIDIMAYIFNALGWAKKVDNHLVLSTKKILSDLPQIKEKTLEASLKALKDVGLIEVKMVVVPEWKNARIRGIYITSSGMSYNSSLYLPKIPVEDLEKEHLKIELKRAKEQIKFLGNQLKNMEFSMKDKPVEVEPQKEKIEPKKVEKPKIEEPKREYENLTLDEFIDNIIFEFGKNSKSICNNVGNGWLPKSTFYINSYNRLAIITPSGEYQQLKDPKKINQFWEWLYNNRDKVGVVHDFEKEVERLNQEYQNKKLKFPKNEFILDQVILLDDGFVKIKLKDIESGNMVTIVDKNKKEMKYDIENCEDIILYCEKAYREMVLMV